jgi:hypothetical protein
VAYDRKKEGRQPHNLPIEYSNVKHQTNRNLGDLHSPGPRRAGPDGEEIQTAFVIQHHAVTIREGRSNLSALYERRQRYRK